MDKNINISVIGAGKLGLCFALTLEQAGFNILACDINPRQVEAINNKKIISNEDGVEKALEKSKNLLATTSLEETLSHSEDIFVLVDTPSLDNNKYDHSKIDSIIDQIIKLPKPNEEKHLIISATVMPGYCNSIQEKLQDHNYVVSYNPEFIAQGTILRDQKNPDVVLIGSGNGRCGDRLTKIYRSFVGPSSTFHLVTPLEAEIAKIALNCFITTKIAFANSIGDLAIKVGAYPQSILDIVSSDSRVGNKCMRYGFGYGGPCFPRDNKALVAFSKEVGCANYISEASDKANDAHLNFMVSSHEESEIVLNSVTYKPESDILEKSQQLLFAVELAKKGVLVTIKERPFVIEQVKKEYGTLFKYEIV